MHASRLCFPSLYNSLNFHCRQPSLYRIRMEFSSQWKKVSRLSRYQDSDSTAIFNIDCANECDSINTTPFHSRRFTRWVFSGQFMNSAIRINRKLSSAKISQLVLNAEYLVERFSAQGRKYAEMILFHLSFVVHDSTYLRKWIFNKILDRKLELSELFYVRSTENIVMKQHAFRRSCR